jgi:hypothetical protein
MFVGDGVWSGGAGFGFMVSGDWLVWGVVVLLLCGLGVGDWIGDGGYVEGDFMFVFLRLGGWAVKCLFVGVNVDWFSAGRVEDWG